LYEKNITIIASKNQTNGEKSNDSITSCALAQFGTTFIHHFIGTIVIQRVTQIIHQIRECDEEAGIQKYQVAKFHNIADNKSEITTIIQNQVD